MISHGDVIGIFFWRLHHSKFVCHSLCLFRNPGDETQKHPKAPARRFGSVVSWQTWVGGAVAAPEIWVPMGPLRGPHGSPDLASYEASSPPCFGPSCDDDVRQSISNDRGWAHGRVASGMGRMGFIGFLQNWGCTKMDINFSYAVGNVNFQTAGF